MASGIIGSLLILLKTKSDINGITKADRALRRTNNTAKMLKNSLRLLSGLGLFFGAKSAIGNYIEFEKNLGAVHSRFMAITGDAQKAEGQFETVRNMARGLGLDMFETANAYSIFFSGTSKTLGEQGAKQVFDSWSKISRVLHLTPYQMERVTYAIREMSSKGAVYSQDLRMQIGTHVPNAVALATQAIQNLGINGVKSIEDFQKVSKGNIPLINKFIKEFSRLAEVQFASPEALANAMKQPDALLNRIKNFGFDFGVAFSNSGGRDALLDVLNTIITQLESLDLNAIANNLGNIIKVIGNLTTFLIKNIPLLVSAIVGLIIAMSTRKFMRMGRGYLLNPNNIGGGLKVSEISYGKALGTGVKIGIRQTILRPLSKLLITILSLFGGWQGILLSLIGSALIGFLPKLWQGITNFLNDRARTVTDKDDIKKFQQKLQEWVNKVKGRYTQEQIDEMIRRNNMYIVYQGQKITPSKVSQDFKIQVNIPNVPSDMDNDDFIKKVTDAMMSGVKKEMEKSDQKNLRGVFKYTNPLRGASIGR